MSRSRKWRSISGQEAPPEQPNAAQAELGYNIEAKRDQPAAQMDRKPNERHHSGARPVFAWH